MNLEIIRYCNLRCCDLSCDFFSDRGIGLDWIKFFESIKVWFFRAFIVNLREDSLELGLELASDFICLILSDITAPH